MLSPAVNFGLGLPKKVLSESVIFPSWLTSAYLKRRRPILLRRLVHIIIALEQADDLVAIERTDRMTGLKAGLLGRTIIHWDIGFAGRQALDPIHIRSEGSGKIEFQLIPHRRSMIGDGHVDPVVGDIAGVDIG